MLAFHWQRNVISSVFVYPTCSLTSMLCSPSRIRVTACIICFPCELMIWSICYDKQETISLYVCVCVLQKADKIVILMCVFSCLTGLVESRFRSSPSVFMSTFVSGSDKSLNSCSVPSARTISTFTFWSAWNAMFYTNTHITHTINIYVDVLRYGNNTTKWELWCSVNSTELFFLPWEPKCRWPSELDCHFVWGCIVTRWPQILR